MPLVQLASLDALSGHAVSDSTIAILPVAATEAHGPHLPATTDCDIAEGHLRALPGYLATNIDAVVLPVERIGASLEHTRFAATESRDAADLVQAWFAIASAVREAGIRRLVIVSSHGGNSAAVDIVTLRARAELGLLAVATAWMRFGYPDGLFDETERRYGIHGGDIETSLMLHYTPGQVDMRHAETFVSRLTDWEAGMTHLSGYGKHRFGWLSSDFNDHGVVGNAAAATADKGAALADHILKGFAELLEDVAAFDLRRLQ
ncbi:creatininase family protein [Pelagibacterium xiamenense]|uniref:creatininase family protein n=1 Tax=Pelagibacterium xiamenense TaxID=2901140 RepID=UPI001E62F5F0|nr:creatininase family protein [Pelagibacterium xiamenense]